jgi:hypothetical protein
MGTREKKKLGWCEPTESEFEVAPIFKGYFFLGKGEGIIKSFFLPLISNVACI